MSVSSQHKFVGQVSEELSRLCHWRILKNLDDVTRSKKNGKVSLASTYTRLEELQQPPFSSYLSTSLPGYLSIIYLSIVHVEYMLCLDINYAMQ